MITEEASISGTYEGIAIRKDQPSQLIRNLYAEVSILWLEEGCFSHYTLIPLGNQVYYEPFLQLSFFIQKVYGIMNIEDYKSFESVSDADIKLANTSAHSSGASGCTVERSSILAIARTHSY